MFPLLLLAATLGTGQPAVPPADWNALKPGLTRGEVVRALGRPLITNAARGLEVWVYDDGANVVFARQHVDAWTEPEHRVPASRLTPAPAAATPAPATSVATAPMVRPPAGDTVSGAGAAGT